MKKVTIMRGIPGSGKSRWVSSILEPIYVVSADDHFTDYVTGEYRFDREKLPTAHNICLERFISLIRAGSNNPRSEHYHVVVDNTNVRTYEIAPYYRLAEVYSYAVEIVWLVCDPAVAIKRGIHGVPEDLVKSMALSFDPLPVWWNVRIIPVT